MANLPTVTGPEAIKAVAKIGFTLVRIQGSHHILQRQGHPFVLSIPVHGNRALKPGTLRSLIRGAGITVDEFTRLL
jgi:predicted RNA binding protein YcfA (HicA-like mRNA interferase family)